MWAFLTLIGFLAFVGSLIGLLFKSVRRKAKWAAPASIVAMFVAAAIFGGEQDDEARRLGFLNAADQRAAKDAGVTDPVAWRSASEAKRRAEQDRPPQEQTASPEPLKTPSEEGAIHTDGAIAEQKEAKIVGKVISFKTESIEVSTRTWSSSIIEITANTGTTGDWAATATEVAKRVVQSGAAPSVKVSLLRADEERLSPPPIRRHLATVYYGPDPKNSPWPDEPTAVFAAPRMLSSREIQSAAEYEKLIEKYEKKGIDPNRADKIAGLEVAKKFHLPNDWWLPTAPEEKLATDFRMITTHVDGEAEKALRALVECVHVVRFAGPRATCPADDERAGNSDDLVRMVKSMIQEDKAQVEARIIGSNAYVIYQLDPWSLTSSTAKTAFNLNIRKLVPAIFGAFPQLEQIIVTATGMFADIKGNETRENFIRATFKRANSISIHWDKISSDNVPKLADDFWAHPSYYRD